MCGSDPKAPSASDVAEASFKAALQYLPGIFDLTNKQILPNELAQLGATKAVEPEYAKLQTDIFKGPGTQLVDALSAKEKEINPEFYAGRAAGGDALTKLLSSIDLSGMLSGSEAAEIERNLHRTQAGEGSSTPSNLGAVKGAMEFGRASTAKKAQQQQAGTNALGAAAGFLPASRAPIDILQVATGRPSYAPQIGATTQAGAQSFLGQSAEATGNAAVLNANRRSGFEKFLSVMPDYT